MNTRNNSSDNTANISLALSSKFIYGTAVGLNGDSYINVKGKSSLKDTLRFIYGEYISGIFFVLAIFCYTFCAPVTMTSPGRLVINMIDKSLKKLFDVLGAILGLILTAPLFVVLAILVKLDSSGPVFYVQDRVGVNRRRRDRRSFKADIDDDNRFRDRRREDYLGCPFKVIKFRTMAQNAEAKSGPIWATRNDARITRIGKFLRKARLDELPQLLNVLGGEMSLVGPRPERPYFVKDLSGKIADYKIRLRVRPGITGLAQVNTGYDSSLDSVNEKVKNDIEYIRTWSIWSDVKILMRTVAVVITGKGAC
ncbi:MAG: sugar transferase [candidate division Zixibacteria bacterium]|nr:sugar transferase [candidate division Zixibacteria bacterium]